MEPQNEKLVRENKPMRDCILDLIYEDLDGEGKLDVVSEGLDGGGSLVGAFEIKDLANIITCFRLFF